MMKQMRFVISFFLLTLFSVSYAETYDTFTQIFMGNPIEMVNDLGANLRSSGLYGSVKKLAYAIAVAGFFFQLYKGLGRNNYKEMRATIVQAVGVMIMLSLVPKAHSAIITSWQTTYTASNSRFSGQLSAKIDAAGTEMSKMIGTVSTAASMGTTAAAYGAKALATGATKKVAVKAGGTFLAKAGSRIGAGAMALSGFTILYSSIIAIAGFIVLALGYVLPLAIAFTMWGQITAIWACIGSAMGAIMITAMMPLLAYSAIDRAFIKPAEATRQFISQNGLSAHYDQAKADMVSTEFYDRARTEMETCKARAANDESVDCTDERSVNIISKAYDFIAQKMGGYIDSFVDIGAKLLDSIFAAIMQVILSVIYFIAAMVFMGAAVNFLTSILGGVASYAGAVAKGGG
ncbi:hypothetical protein D3875_03345 [Deinococcus cavernae]|uniref:Uncharacterized protein n=1 Tax=Deinococcus cavernae TaxID=2320857 RepID=A0A418VEQ5_9DEIO|nr:hypothetical protein [Deinococcus cavernae]RJF74589.1 hypothetical protein D3875_03345 [Deinococcus cavernae]